MVSHTVYFKGMMVFTLTSQMYHRISVLVPVLVRVPEYLSTSTSTSTMTLELTSTSTRNSVLRVLSTSTPALIIRNWPLFFSSFSQIMCCETALSMCDIVIHNKWQQCSFWKVNRSVTKILCFGKRILIHTQ